MTSIGVSAFYICTSLTSITIPDNVTRLGNSAFNECKSLKSVSIGNSVTILGDDAFSLCESLTSITIPDNVTSIGARAFHSCTSLISIAIPDNVTSLGSDVLSFCYSLKSVTIGKGVNRISRYDFSYDNALESIIVRSGNPTYDSRDNCNAIIEKATNTLIYGCKNTVIPNSVSSIAEGAFENCSSLTSVNIPDGVTSIGNGAFSGCAGLTSIEISNSVTSIGSFAFYKCTGLASIEIPNRVNYIGSDAFKRCTGMTDVYCYANPSALTWKEDECDDFKAERATKCHVFNTEDWNSFRNSVNVEFVGDLVLDLADNANNDALLNTWNGRIVNMKLQGRTFFKKGQCNTLCLPFTVTDKNVDDEVSFSGTPFEGTTAMTLDNASFSNGTLTLNFKNVTTIKAGKPYIIKWPMVNNNDYYCANPTFHDVTITSTTPTAISNADDMVTFTGTFSPVALVKDDLTKLFLGLNNVLYSPKSNMAINACRAWFQLVSPITTVGDMNGDRGINVTDVTSLVNLILGNANSNIIIANADVNSDGGINVTDVTSLVNLILNSNDNIYNVVVNIDGNTITYNGSSNGDPRAGENHIWDE